MRVRRVPGHTVVEDDEHVLVRWREQSGQYRAEFVRDGDRATFAQIIVERERHQRLRNATLSNVPDELVEQLRFRGYDVREAGEPEGEPVHGAAELNTVGTPGREGS